MSVTPIFISYRRADSADVTGRIYDRLCEHFGKESMFIDVDDIPLGVDFRAHLDEKLRDCHAFLAVIGRTWLSAKDEHGRLRLEDPKDVVRIEIESALTRKIPVIPLLVHGAQMPSEDHLPKSLRGLANRNAILIRPDPDFRNDMDRLIGSLGQSLRRGGRGVVANAATDPASPSLGVITPQRTAGRNYSGAVQTMSFLLVLAELIQVAVFLVTETDDIRFVSVIAPNLVGVGLIVAGSMRRNIEEIILGATAAAAPWLLRFLVSPFPAIVSTAVAVLVLAVLVLRNLGWPKLTWFNRGRNRPSADDNLPKRAPSEP
jgi:hypothetical protein